MEYVSSVERVWMAQADAKVQEAQAAMQDAMQDAMQAAMQDAMQTLSGMLSRQLTKRFGNLPEDVAGQIKNASKEQIEIWFDRGMEAATLDAVFHDPTH